MRQPYGNDKSKKNKVSDDDAKLLRSGQKGVEWRRVAALRVEPVALQHGTKNQPSNKKALPSG